MGTELGWATGRGGPLFGRDWVFLYLRVWFARRCRARTVGAMQERTQAMFGNFAQAVQGLRSSLGLEAVDVRDEVSCAVAEVLAERNHRADVLELRFGVLTLLAAQPQAAFLSYDRDQIVAALSKRCPGVVKSLKIRVGRQ